MVMLNRLIATIISFATCMAVCAQGTCIIKGKIEDCNLANGKTIKTVYLTRTDEYGQKSNVATAKVKKGTYSFKYKMAKNEPAVLYTITGFEENRNIELFVEPGTITVNTVKATEPEQTIAYGTSTNDTFAEYKNILKEFDAADATELIKREAARIRFLIDHNSSPMTPFEMERSVMPYLSETYAEQMVKCVSTELYGHPHYLSFRNAVLARTLKVGNEIPDIAIPQENGTAKRLNELRGKFILLDFWASTCEASMEARETLKELYEMTKEKQEQFVIVSQSMDKNNAAWLAAIKEKGLGMPGWVHGCDTTGETIKFFGAEKTPQMILVDPEGRAISLDMDCDEVIEKVEMILAGDLYYLDQKE